MFNFFKKKTQPVKKTNKNFEIELTASILAYEIARSDGDISEMLFDLFDLRPYSIEKLFHLRKPIYLETAAYGHMGREPQKVKKTFVNSENKFVEFDLELFNWEKLDYVDKLKKLFKLAQ